MADRSGGDGKALENLVATIERLLVPRGFKVEKNQREYDGDGVPVGEFDITIRGHVGSAPIAILIECRNRPSEGPAPGSWIQQLVGRRSQFGFHSVVAVSTTGFSASAVDCATKKRIELREMSQLEQLAPDLAAWLSTRVLHSQEVRHMLSKAGLQIGEQETAEREQAVTAVVTTTSLKEPLLRSTGTKEIISLVDAFQGAVQALPHLYDGVLPNQPPKHVTFNCNFMNDDDHYVVDTTEGPVRITSIYFDGELSIHQTDIPLSEFSEYRARGNKDPVAQTATFTFPVKEQNVTLDLHHLRSNLRHGPSHGGSVHRRKRLGTQNRELLARHACSECTSSQLPWPRVMRFEFYAQSGRFPLLRASLLRKTGGSGDILASNLGIGHRPSQCQLFASPECRRQFKSRRQGGATTASVYD